MFHFIFLSKFNNQNFWTLRIFQEKNLEQKIKIVMDSQSEMDRYSHYKTHSWIYCESQIYRCYIQSNYPSTLQCVSQFFCNTDGRNAALLAQTACVLHPRWRLQCVAGHCYYHRSVFLSFFFGPGGFVCAIRGGVYNAQLAIVITNFHSSFSLFVIFIFLRKKLIFIVITLG